MDPTQTAFTLDPAQTAFTLDPTQTALTLDPESTMDRTHSGPWIHHTLHPVRILNPPWVHPTLHPAWALDPAYLQVPELDQVGQRVPGQGLRLLPAWLSSRSRACTWGWLSLQRRGGVGG